MPKTPQNTTKSVRKGLSSEYLAVLVDHFRNAFRLFSHSEALLTTWLQSTSTKYKYLFVVEDFFSSLKKADENCLTKLKASVSKNGFCQLDMIFKVKIC